MFDWLFKSIKRVSLCLRDQCVTVLIQYIHACSSVWQLEDLHIVALSLNEWMLELEYIALEY